MKRAHSWLLSLLFSSAACQPSAPLPARELSSPPEALPSSRVEPTALPPSKTIGVKLGRESFECDEGRCKGSFARGALRFDALEEGARVRYDSDAEVELVDVGPKQRDAIASQRPTSTLCSSVCRSAGSATSTSTRPP
jgi:hypothetical protein